MKQTPTDSGSERRQTFPVCSQREMSVRCFSLIGDIKEELALISSRQCKQCFFGISSNQFLNWWYTFYDWNSVDIISPDIYQKKNIEVHVGWHKGISPFSFLALHQ